MSRACLLLFVALTAVWPQDTHVTLAIGSPAPDFALPGVDGKTHKLSDYAASPLLAIVFTCNHCPTAQLYEDRIKRIAADYRSKGVALVAIQPNDPNALRIDEMVMSDMSLRVHHHTAELVENSREWRHIQHHTEPKYVTLCLDLEHAQPGGVDPNALL